jgi:Cu(I)/Ag(I) efflux system periplasmic protein CusF
MKRLVAVLAVAAFALGFAPLSFAQSSAQTHKASGTVTKVDRIASKVTIAHGPVESLKWPAMTMNFLVRDKALLDKLPPGKKIDFEFVQQGRDYVLTSAR